MTDFEIFALDHQRHNHCQGCGGCLLNPSHVVQSVACWCVGCRDRIKRSAPKGAPLPWRGGVEFVALLLAALVCVGCLTVKPASPPTPATRTLTIQTCVADAAVWLDGAQVPPLSGVTDAAGTMAFPAFPATVTAFNLHASSPRLPEYGAVIHCTASTEALVVILGSCGTTHDEWAPVIR